MTGTQRISQMIKSTHKRLYWLAYVSAFGGVAIVLAAWLILSLSGITELFPTKLRAATTLTAMLMIAFLALRSFRRFIKPSLQEAFKYVDLLSESRPATTLIDNPVHPHERAAKLWREYRERVAKEAEKLPNPSLWSKARAIDPMFLRFIVPVGLLLAVFSAGDLATTRLKSTFHADFGSLVGADKLKTHAWVAPPPYTGQAPFDAPINESFRAPAGSDFTLRVETQGKPTLRLHYKDRTETIKLRRGDDGTFESTLKLDLKDDVRAEILYWGVRASYSMSTNPDQAPKIEFEGYPKSDENDRIKFGWKAEDDYGLAKIELVLQPSKPNTNEVSISDSIKLEIPSIEPHKANETVALNLTRHKWAGTEIIAHLKATDASGQFSTSQDVVFTLPEKLFLQPMAKAAMEVRSVVLRDSDSYEELNTAPTSEVMDGGLIKTVMPSPLENATAQVRRASVMLDALTYKPETYFNDPVIYLGLRQAKQIISNANTKPEADTSETVLWAVAMRSEYGSLADAARALEAARKALEAALRDGAPENEVKRLMQAYRQAVENYVEMRTAEALRRGIDPAQLDGPAGSSQSIGDSELERMLKALEQLTETGASDQARQLLSDMNDLLERMKDMKFSQGGGGNSSQKEEGPMSRALEKLAEELRAQRDLNDDTNQAQKEKNQQGESNDSKPSTNLNSLAQRQREIIERGPTSQSEQSEGAPEGMSDLNDQADQSGQYPVDEEGYRIDPNADSGAQARAAQERAAEALANGDLEAAIQHQKTAEEALTRAATEMAATADRIRGEAGLEKLDNANTSDPLGRPTGQGLIGDGDDVKVPDEIERQRAHQILEELRERSAKSGLTDEEMDYLLRLLKRF